YLTHPLDGSDAALDVVKQQVFNDEGFERQWADLLPADQIVLELIVNGGQDLFGSETRAQIGKALGIDEPVKKSTPQNALTRLMNKNLITRFDTGKYQFEDEAFADWVRYRDA